VLHGVSERVNELVSRLGGVLVSYAMKFKVFQLTTVEFVGFAGWLVIESVTQKSHSCNQ
jgi:hypothetical protein